MGTVMGSERSLSCSFGSSNVHHLRNQEEWKENCWPMRRRSAWLSGWGRSTSSTGDSRKSPQTISLKMTLSLHPEVFTKCQMAEPSPSLWLVCTCVFTLLSDYARSYFGAFHLHEPMTNLPPKSFLYMWKKFDLWLQRKPMSKLDFFRTYLGNTCSEKHGEPGTEGETKETSYLPFYTLWWRRQDRLVGKSQGAFCPLSLTS